MVKKLGFTAAKLLLDLLKPNAVVAISGGSTMAAVAEEMPVLPLILLWYQPVVALVR